MANLDQIPTRQGEFHYDEIDGQTLLFDDLTKKTIFLNESATTIWKLCDGTRTIRDIVALLQEAFPDSKDNFEADVIDTLNNLLSAGAMKCEIASNPPGASGH